MLIICNGAFKSGSTWVYALVHSILRVKGVHISEIPKEYGAGKSPVFGLKESELSSFIQKEDLSNSTYLTKAHFFATSTLQYCYPEAVKFVFVERDLRDALVSHYHHFQIYRKLRISFNVYYWLLGRFKAYEIWLYNNRCRASFDQNNFFRFELMKSNIDETLSRLAQILCVTPLAPHEAQTVIQDTDIRVMRKKAQQGDRSFYSGAGDRSDKLFREGRVGAYSEYLSPSILVDLEKIIAGQFSLPSRLIYTLNFTARRKLKAFWGWL